MSQCESNLCTYNPLLNHIPCKSKVLRKYTVELIFNEIDWQIK